MSPTFKNKDSVLAFSYVFNSPHVNDVVVIKKQNKYMVKRIIEIKNMLFFVVGDNRKNSTDSRHFGYITRNDIIGRVILKL